MEINAAEFDKIRPYFDYEVHDAIERIIKERGFIKTLEYFFPNAPIDATLQMLRSLNTIKEFQREFIVKLVCKMEQKSMKSFTFSGLENIEKGKPYLFLSNHRDIILDSALLNSHLALEGFETSEIAIGSNLLILPWITDLVKLNRTFIVHRNISVKELYESSLLLSKYINYTIKEKNTSVWLAQREGRTKNGDDKTQVSILKMLNMSSKGSVIDNLKSLNIVPMTISYEYEPCDVLKVVEQYNKKIDKTYKKSKIDDMTGMRYGLECEKGNVTIHLGKPLNEEFDSLPKIDNKNLLYEEIVKFIDKKIYSGYKFYPINYVAADILTQSNKYSANYTDEEKQQALKYIESQCVLFIGDVDLQKKMLLEIYANPVFNYDKL